MLNSKILDRQLPDLPKEVQFCKKCVVSNQRPRIQFDEHGVCTACRYADIKKNEIDWDTREQLLVELCDQHRSRDGSFDVVVPSSGGKDSSIPRHMPIKGRCELAASLRVSTRFS